MSEGGTHEPYIPARSTLRELTPLPLVAGTLLGMVFGASSLYLVLKVGLTVSASIPVAVISITLFRLLSKLGVKNATILENNVVQTAGSAGESIAFGVGVTMPAIMILGFDLEITRVMLVAVLGGLLGILMMIPLRRALIVDQHGSLKYPEGTACAEVLKAGASDESRAAAHSAGAPPDETEAGGGKTIFAGFGIGLAYKAVMVALRGWKDVPEKVFTSTLKGGSVSTEISPELLGVGYIIGPRIAAIMCAGGVLAYLVLIPAIKFFGDAATVAIPPGTIPIREMNHNQIRGAYVLYIGAGAVAAGGIISLARSLPTIWHGIRGGLRDLRGGSKTGEGARPRTDQDLSLKWVLIGVLVLITAITLAPALHMNVLGAVLIVVLGFLFVTVSSRLTGEIGSSSNPISGMTVATLLLTCGVFLLLGWTAPPYYVTALSVGAIVCIAASNGGTTSQDLKTGFLVGATPKYQQYAILVGALASALVLGPILLRLNAAATVYVPQATFEKVAPVAVADDVVRGLPPWQGTLPEAGKSYRRLQQADEKATPEPGAVQVPGLAPGSYVVDESTKQVTHKLEETFSGGLATSVAGLDTKEALAGPQAKTDPATYRVWQKTDSEGGPPGKYLVDDAGRAVYLVDPGINGTHSVRPDGTKVAKFDAPKATLMSYIIKGILNRELPWGLVLLGVMISVVLELSGIPSLAFAVGVYLPISSSTPILAGGLVRWLADKQIQKRLAGKNLTEEQLVAETDKSPGVLLSSGYIAGGAIAGIVIAFVAGVMGDVQTKIDDWAKHNNPLFEGPSSDALSMIPFIAIAALLYSVAVRNGNAKKSAKA
ncbi:MAG: oligopeptide transporter, OPT family [Myxococcales bacterium]|nr:oligopeptide transporter, OPT family [Myxococcales bacterium]